MNELPAPGLQTKHAGNANRSRHNVLSAADLSATAFPLDDAGEIAGEVLADELDIGDLSVAVVRGGAGKCRLHLLPTPYVRPEGIPQGHVICKRAQRLVDTR